MAVTTTVTHTPHPLTQHGLRESDLVVFLPSTACSQPLLPAISSPLGLSCSACGGFLIYDLLFETHSHGVLNCIEKRGAARRREGKGRRRAKEVEKEEGEEEEEQIRTLYSPCTAPAGYLQASSGYAQTCATLAVSILVNDTSLHCGAQGKHPSLDLDLLLGHVAPVQSIDKPTASPSRVHWVQPLLRPPQHRAGSSHVYSTWTHTLVS